MQCNYFNSKKKKKKKNSTDFISSERNFAQSCILIIVNHNEHSLRTWIIWILNKNILLTSLTSDKWSIVQMNTYRITYLQIQKQFQVLHKIHLSSFFLKSWILEICRNTAFSPHWFQNIFVYYLHLNLFLRKADK